MAPELVVPEMANLMGSALGAHTFPATFLTDPDTAASRPQDFTAWLAAAASEREIRSLLEAGIWPGPKGTPSLQTIMSAPTNRRVFVATLWGEGCEDEGPWGDLWRSRGVQQGLQAVFWAKSGRIVVTVMARATGQPPFSAKDVAFGEAAAPIIESAIDAAVHPDPYDEAVPTVQVTMDASDVPKSMSFMAAETLRDIGGGRAGAIERSLTEISAKAAAVARVPRLSIPGDPFIGLRQRAASGGSETGLQPMKPIHLGRNAFGEFSMKVSPLSGAGEGAQLVTIQRRVPRTLLAIRGALRAQISARELELTIALSRGATLEGSASRLGVGLSTVKTMIDRIQLRTMTESRSSALSKMIEDGRSNSW